MAWHGFGIAFANAQIVICCVKRNVLNSIIYGGETKLFRIKTFIIFNNIIIVISVKVQAIGNDL